MSIPRLYVGGWRRVRSSIVLTACVAALAMFAPPVQADSTDALGDTAVVATPAPDSSQIVDLPAETETVDTVDDGDEVPQNVVVPVDALDTLLASFLDEDTVPAMGEDTAVSVVARSAWHRVLRGVTSLGPIRWIRARWWQLLVLVLSAAIIWRAVAWYLGRAEGKRFLTTTRLSIMDKEVQRACRHVERHFADPELTCESLCEFLVTGESFLGALFKRELGMGVEDFIAQVRVNHVMIVLRTNPEAPLPDLAVESGFADEEALHETFELVTGTTIEKCCGAWLRGEEV